MQGTWGEVAGLEGNLPPLLAGNCWPSCCLPLNKDKYLAPGPHIVDKNQPPAVHPVAEVVASGGEVLLLAETAVLNSAAFLSSSLAAASAALAAVASAVAAAPVAAAFALLTPGVQQCPRFDLRAQPAAGQCPGAPR